MKRGATRPLFLSYLFLTTSRRLPYDSTTLGRAVCGAATRFVVPGFGVLAPRGAVPFVAGVVCTPGLARTIDRSELMTAAAAPRGAVPFVAVVRATLCCL